MRGASLSAAAYSPGAIADLCPLPAGLPNLPQKFPPQMKQIAQIENIKEGLREKIERVAQTFETLLRETIEERKKPKAESLSLPAEITPPNDPPTMKTDSFSNITTARNGRIMIPTRNLKLHRWTRDITEKIAYTAAQTIVKEHRALPPKNEDGSYKGHRSFTEFLLPIFIDAQNQILPPEKRKKIVTFQHIAKPVALLDRTQHYIDQLRNKTNGKHDELKPEPAQVEHGPTGGDKLTAETAKLLARNIDLGALDDETLIRALLARMNKPPAPAIPDEVTAKLKEQDGFIEQLIEENAQLTDRMKGIEKLLYDMQRTATKEEGRIRAALPSVAIIGLLRDQFQQVVAAAKEAGMNLDLRYIDSGKTSPHPLNTEYAINTRFGNTKNWDEQIRHSINPGKFLLMAGGTSKVLDQLKVWFQ